MEIRCFLAKCWNTCAHMCTRRNPFFFSLSCSHTHTVAPAIYSHLSHTGKCIHVLRAPISLLCLSIFSLTHSPKQSPSITTSLHFSSSLSLFISPSSTVNHSFLFPPSLTHPTFISLLYHSPHSSPPLVCFYLSLSLSVIQALGCS